MRIFFVRHGQSQLNIEGKVQGHIDSSLTELGINQAKKFAQSLGDIKFDAFFSSDLGRTKDTAQLIATQLGNQEQVIGDFRIRERNYGDYEGVTIEYIHQDLHDQFLQRNALLGEERRRFKLHPSMENDIELMQRYDGFLSDTYQKYKGKNLLAVSHGDFMRTSLIHLSFCKYGELHGGSIENLGYYVLEFDDENRKIVKTQGIWRFCKMPGTL